MVITAQIDLIYLNGNNSSQETEIFLLLTVPSPSRLNPNSSECSLRVLSTSLTQTTQPVTIQHITNAKCTIQCVNITHVSISVLLNHDIHISYGNVKPHCWQHFKRLLTTQNYLKNTKTMLQHVRDYHSGNTCKGKVKVKEGHTPKERRHGAHLPFIGRWARR